MIRKLSIIPFTLLAVLCSSLWFASAQSTGRIVGQVTDADDEGIGGVAVVIAETRSVEITDRDGRYRFDRIPPGTYTLSFTLGDNTGAKSGVQVTAGSTTTADLSVDWDFNYLETVTVFSASRRRERVVDAPAAVTVITEEKIEQQAAHGQVPKLLEFTPGVEVTQSGVYDYNFNTRGFNSSLNRRVATLIDGRDPSVPFLGAQEWAAISFPLDDLANVELLRGPSAALYGANASSGVLNMTTKAPRDSLGGTVRFSGGELNTFNTDFRWATELGGDWYLKIVGGSRDSGDFTVSRNGKAEYAVPCDRDAGIVTNCLPQERVPLDPENDNQIRFGSLRLDKYIGNDGLLTVEGGLASVVGPVFQTGIGRVQLVDIERPWARANYSTRHWNFLAYYTGRDAPRQTALGPGNNLSLDTEKLQFEVQTNWDLAGDRGRIVFGASYGTEDINSLDKTTGRQTLIFAPVDNVKTALFGQFDWKFTDKVKFVLASRFDTSDLHTDQFSPKASLVFSPNDNHTIRLTYNEAFQVANYSEFFLQADVAAPVDLRAIEAGFCTPFGVDCGFGSPTRILALGNEDLDVETVKTYEIGWSGIFAGKAFVTAEYYFSQNSNFITDLIPQLGTALGRVNPNFGPYTPPSDLPDPVAAAMVSTLQGALGPTYGILSNNVDGTPIFAAVSYANFGDVDTQGIDFGLNYYIDRHWSWQLSYSWFDFDIKSALPGFENILLPNSPENRVSAGFAYDGPAWDLSFSGRWVDDFLWYVGPFQGVVESYTTFDLNTNFDVNDRWSIGLNVANIFDDAHWESFGGDILGRRAIAHVAFDWE